MQGSARALAGAAAGGAAAMPSGGESAADVEAAAEAEQASQVVMVKRRLLAACMTCPLCKKLLRDATTISECLHTFCRKCIYEKLTDEEMDCCPICSKDLGGDPVEKLRADHNLQDVRSKIFPFKRRKIRAPEVASPITLPVRRKERSLSSLVVNAPRASSQTALTGRRTKAVARRASALRGLGPIMNESVKGQTDNAEKHAENSSSHDSLSKTNQARKLISTNAEPSNHAHNKDSESDNKQLLDKAELWRPLNCLVEAANRTKPFKTSAQGASAKLEQLNGPNSDALARKTKIREHLPKSKKQDEKKDVSSMPSMSARPRKAQGSSCKKRVLGASANSVLDPVTAQHERRFNAIWLSLVASFDQNEESPLPQIPANYLRIKDADTPASSIQKYLAQKLHLQSESEVEINCRGQPVNPTLPLHNLVDLWLRGGSAQRVQASVGMPAKDFVMVLTYSRPKASTS